MSDVSVGHSTNPLATYPKRSLSLSSKASATQDDARRTVVSARLLSRDSVDGRRSRVGSKSTRERERERESDGGNSKGRQQLRRRRLLTGQPRGAALCGCALTGADYIRAQHQRHHSTVTTPFLSILSIRPIRPLTLPRNPPRTPRTYDDIYTFPFAKAMRR